MENRIRYWRKKRGLTEVQLGGLAGCTNPQIHFLETGKRALTITWLQKLASALNVPPSALLLDTDAKMTAWGVTTDLELVSDPGGLLVERGQILTDYAAVYLMANLSRLLKRGTVFAFSLNAVEVEPPGIYLYKDKLATRIGEITEKSESGRYTIRSLVDQELVIMGADIEWARKLLGIFPKGCA